MAEVQGLDAAMKKLDLYASGLRSGANLAAQEIANLLEAYAKAHHPWEDRSGNTNTSTKGMVVPTSGDVIHIILSAGMSYDIFLEDNVFLALAKAGTWAWLWPAVVANKENIRAILRKRLGAVRV